MYNTNLFKDKVVLVTGGRSGIGYGIAKQYLDLGAKIMIVSRKEALLKTASEELSEYGICHYQACDIRKTDDIKALAEAIKGRYGRLDILVNNAGGQFPAPANLISENGWAAVINNNLNGTFYMSQIMANTFFIPQKSGNIVNIIASVIRGIPGMAHTGAARAGVENLTKTLGQEWAEYNIRINAIAPGIIKSSGLDTYADPIKDFLKEITEANAMKRLGNVEDVSNAVMFLSSPLSAYTSGITLYVDGLDHLVLKGTLLYEKLKSLMG